MNKKHILFGIAALFAAATVLTALNYTFTQAIVGELTPSIIGMSPVSGPTAGGTTVVLTGSYFDSSAAVTFGSAAATVVSVTPTTITVTTPANPAGPVSVLVTQTSGSSNLYGPFTYVAPVTPPPPQEDVCKKQNKTAVCHLPLGKEENAQSLCLPKSAVDTHLAHGDYLGACNPEGGTDQGHNNN